MYDVLLRAQTKHAAAWAAPASTFKDAKERHKAAVALPCRPLLLAVLFGDPAIFLRSFEQMHQK